MLPAVPRSREVAKTSAPPRRGRSATPTARSATESDDSVSDASSPPHPVDGYLSILNGPANFKGFRRAGTILIITITIGRSYRRCVNDFASSIAGRFDLTQFRSHRQIVRLPYLRIDKPLEFLGPTGRGEPIALGCCGDGQGDHTRDAARFRERGEERSCRVMTSRGTICQGPRRRHEHGVAHALGLYREDAQAQPGEDVAVVALGDRVPTAAVQRRRRTGFRSRSRPGRRSRRSGRPGLPRPATWGSRAGR